MADKLTEVFNKIKDDEDWKKYDIKCVLCEKSYQSVCALNKHYKTKHDTKGFNNRKKLLCPVCEEETSCRVSLERHLLSEHEIQVEKVNFQVTTIEEFSNWKKLVEKENNCLFVKKSGSKKIKISSSEETLTYFYCYRSGASKSRGRRLRKLKQQGSNKINTFCPSMIKCKETDKQIVIEYTKTHLGHDNTRSIYSSKRKHLKAGFRKIIDVSNNNDACDSYIASDHSIGDEDNKKEENMCKLTHVINKSNMQKVFNMANMPVIDNTNITDLSVIAPNLSDMKETATVDTSGDMLPIVSNVQSYMTYVVSDGSKFILSPNTINTQDINMPYIGGVNNVVYVQDVASSMPNYAEGNIITLSYYPGITQDLKIDDKNSMNILVDNDCKSPIFNLKTETLKMLQNISEQIRTCSDLNTIKKYRTIVNRAFTSIQNTNNNSKNDRKNNKVKKNCK